MVAGDFCCSVSGLTLCSLLLSTPRILYNTKYYVIFFYPYLRVDISVDHTSMSIIMIRHSINNQSIMIFIDQSTYLLVIFLFQSTQLNSSLNNNTIDVLCSWDKNITSLSNIILPHSQTIHIILSKQNDSNE